MPIELPQAKGQQLQSNKEPLTISVRQDGKVFIQETEIKLDEIAPKLKAIAKNGYDEQIFVRGDKGIDYGTVMRVMGRIKAAGFTKVSLVTEAEGLVDAQGRSRSAGRIGRPPSFCTRRSWGGRSSPSRRSASCAWPSRSRSPSIW